MRTRQIAFGMGLFLAAGCAGQSGQHRLQPDVAFSQFHTFALVMPPDTAARQLLDQRVRNAVRVQLAAAKGLAPSDRQHADLFVGYGMVERRIPRSSTPRTAGGGAEVGDGATTGGVWRGR